MRRPACRFVHRLGLSFCASFDAACESLCASKACVRHFGSKLSRCAFLVCAGLPFSDSFHFFQSFRISGEKMSESFEEFEEFDFAPLSTTPTLQSLCSKVVQSLIVDHAIDREKLQLLPAELRFSITCDKDFF